MNIIFFKIIQHIIFDIFDKFNESCVKISKTTKGSLLLHRKYVTKLYKSFFFVNHKCRINKMSSIRNLKKIIIKLIYGVCI